jgi:Bacterial Ig-like domain (group 3)/Beta-propeller repeat
MDCAGEGIAVDSSGNAYVTGDTCSTDFPTMNPLQPANDGTCGWGNAFVTKLNPSGSALVYSTYLGGSVADAGLGIAVDSSGNAYVTGETLSPDFPITPGAFQTACGGGGSGCWDAFVAKINSSGSALVYSTYLGGDGVDAGWGIAVDRSSDAYVTGQTNSTNFPVTPGALQTTCGSNSCSNSNAFVSKLNPSGSALVYSTYLGGSGGDYGNGIAVDSSDDAYVAGVTESTNFPTMNPLQPTFGGAIDAFVSKVNSSGSTLVYSTYLGGSGQDFGQSIAVDSSGNAYVTGATESTNFPTVSPLQPANGGSTDAFVAKLNPSGSALLYSTYLGGAGYDSGNGIAVDSSGNAYVNGTTNSANFPTMNPLQAALAGGGDAFVAEINSIGSALAYSTYLGGSGGEVGEGIAVDSSGSAFVTGFTTSTNFPTMNPLQPVYGGGYSDAYVAKIGSISSATTTTLTRAPNPSVFGQSVTFTATVTSQGSGTPTGTVTFTDGLTTLCNAVTLVGGVATCAYSALPVGSSIVTATYSGDSNFSGSSASLNQTVNQANTALILVSSLNPSGLDSPVTFTATITPQYGGQATGTVTFKDGSTALGSGAVSGNAARLTTSGLATGTHSITAVYSGDSNFTGSTSNTLSQVVTKATTTTTLLSSINPSVQGKPVTFTAVVSSLAGTPTGKIKYLNGTTVLATLALTSGSAKYTTSKLPPGSNIMTAVYEGDSNNSGSTSAPVNQFVLAATTTTLTSSPNPSAYGEVVIFTARVTSSIGAPPDGETVTFKQGATVLGTGPLSGGTATLSKSTLGVGTKSVTAAYGGDSKFAGSKSNTVNQVVNKARTTTTLVSSQNPSNVGQSVTFTANVTPQFSGKVTGTVTFYDGTTALKTVGLSGGVDKFTTATLTSGAHNITATYNGSASFTGSSASLTQMVN